MNTKKFRLDFLMLLLISCILFNSGLSQSDFIGFKNNLENLTYRCLECHDDYEYRVGFAQSVHRENTCTSCHKGITDFEKHSEGLQLPTQPHCRSCHSNEARDFQQNVHYLMQNFSCYDCHLDIHTVQKSGEDIKKQIIRACATCHPQEEYVHSGHALAVLEKNNLDAASCDDCHGLHNTKLLHTSTEKYPEEAREFYNKSCKRCHSDKEMMLRNNLSTITVDEYEHTYHGKVQDLGYPTTVAGCADCHTSHNILPRTDPASTIHPDNLIANCGRCHPNSNANFVKYEPHAEYTNARKNPILFFTFVAMSSLLIIVFIFFWIHTFLWWRKDFWDKYKLEASGMVLKPKIEHHEATQVVERFKPAERLMHFILMITFFTLVITGMPLKFHTTAWAKFFIGILGGAHSAGIIHRIAASIMILLFGYVFYLSLRYLKPAGKFTWKRFFNQLFGPDSLFPNKKDWEDLKGMFCWFFDKGEKPQFDRWTYWEKFDFLAVFWGMLAVGGSGLILWAPEWASYFFPGWIFNVATIVHSDEALLASGFIFTVHFFNTHFIPSKFPMDTIIFTGRYRVEELYETRKLHYERLKESGEIENIQRRFPTIITTLISSAIGLASLLMGFFLTTLIIWGLFIS
ncbi:cytochrome C [candidate division KSB1 bacterium]|nr:cytochrome C [candidate division KSB1 bacterium]